MKLSRLIFTSLYLCLTLTLSTCQIPDAYGDLSLLVLDSSGLPVANAQVSIYASETDYLNETNALVENSFTDEEGGIDFFDLTLDTCFVDVQVEALNNWEGKSQIGLIKTENGYNNFEVFVIFESRTGMIARSEGKKWQRQRIIFNGNDISDEIPACELDDEYIFYKNQQFLQREGSSTCDPDNPSDRDYNWRFNDNNTALIIESGGSLEEWVIVNISQNQLRVQQNISAEAGNFINVEVIYEPL